MVTLKSSVLLFAREESFHGVFPLKKGLTLHLTAYLNTEDHLAAVLLI